MATYMQLKEGMGGSVDLGYYFMHLGALIGVGPLVWLYGWGLSCYYPFLLSARFYCVVNHPILQKILISTQLTRSQNSRTRIEDQNKLSAIGLLYYIIGAVFLAAFYVSDICVLIRDTTGMAAPVIHTLAFFSPYLIIGMAILCIVTLVFYWIDYTVGKRFDSKQGRH